MTGQPSHEVRVERGNEAGVTWLRFNTDHPANIVTPSLLDEIARRVDVLAVDPTVRVMMLAGADTVFAGGADLLAMQTMPDDDYQAYIATEYRLFRLVENLPFITIAVVAGACVGNGAELALACDLRIAGTSSRIGFPEPRVGFVAPAQRLSRYVGIGWAKEILYTGRLLKSAEAAELGLFTEVVDDAELWDRAAEVASEYASRAPIALRRTKEGLERAYGAAGDHDAAERAAAFETFKSADFIEGSSATLERRAPVFAGR
jgi:enoyl-CoA hydratase/carnithine racemase